ncbi:PSD1 [Auxenochlorella protothecoides x Auxenochlorella symbiontica]
MLRKVSGLLRRGHGQDAAAPRSRLHTEDTDHDASGKGLPQARLPSRIFPDGPRQVSEEETFGLLKLTLHCAQLLQVRRDRPYFAVLSIGSQTLTSARIRAPAHEDVCLTWEASSHFVLQRSGPTLARVAIYRGGKYKGALNNFLECWCQIDLATYFDNEPGARSLPEGGWHDLLSANGSDGSASQHAGRLKVSAAASSPRALESQLWTRLLPLADFDGNGSLNDQEFVMLMQAFGADLEEHDLEGLWRRVADPEGAATPIAQLADRMTRVHSGGDLASLMKRCPVDGAALVPGQDLANLIYMTLVLDEGLAPTTPSATLKGGYSTAQQASRAWMLRMTEWLTHPLAGAPSGILRGNKYAVGGLRLGAQAAHILVVDRRSRLVVEEKLGVVLSLAMRNMYQSRMGRVLMREGFFARLKSMSETKGRYMDSPESVKDIPIFLHLFKDDLNLSEIRDPIDSFRTFNQFFFRELKPGARPIASPTEDSVIVSCADCRLIVYESVDEATRFWIKGRRFSVAGLLADASPERELSAPHARGTLAIFRLAPQDYHRFHAPLGGSVVSITPVPGELFTVNPIAIHSEFVDVFTENKRSILWLDTPEFGRVAFVAVGATLVGSIVWSVGPGDAVAKGQELGYFAFGGSTCILLLPDAHPVVWDEDLLQYGRKSLETLVRVGERVGVHAGSALETPAEERAALATSTAAATAGIMPLEERAQGMDTARDEAGLLMAMSPVASPRVASTLAPGSSPFGWGAELGGTAMGEESHSSDSSDGGYVSAT